MFRTLVCAALLAGTAVSAEAAVMEAKFAGTVLSFYDLHRSFGTAFETAVENSSSPEFTLTFVYDTNVGQRVSSPGQYDSLTNGTLGESPTLSATLTIGGVAQAVEATYSSYQLCSAEICSAYRYAAFAQEGTSSDGGFSRKDVYGSLTFDPFLLNLDAPFSVVGLDLISQYGFFSLTEVVDGVYIHNATGTLAIDRLTVRNTSDTPSPVPLPASAPLLLAALAGVAALRRRRLARV